MRRDHLYHLNKQGEPCVSHNIDEWLSKNVFEDTRRVVKQEKVKGVLVSTVFLGIDHNFSGQGPPILWETMTFGGKSQTWRCAGSREQALAQHERIVKQLQSKQL